MAVVLRLDEIVEAEKREGQDGRIPPRFWRGGAELGERDALEGDWKNGPKNSGDGRRVGESGVCRDYSGSGTGNLFKSGLFEGKRGGTVSRSAFRGHESFGGALPGCETERDFDFPCLTLLVAGGHC